jgi:protein associated with RNAse G/E
MNKNIIKCCLPLVKGQRHKGEQDYILKQGILNNNRTVLVTNDKEADLIILDMRNLTQPTYYDVIYPNKTIIVDYSDGYNKIFLEPCLLYFKRSFINVKNEIFKSDVNYIPIQYALRMCYVEESKKQKDIEQDIDISVIFDNTQKKPKKTCNRVTVTNFIESHAKLRSFKKQIGLVSSGDEKGRSEYNEKYWDTLSRSKIVVTCNPTNWEGDQRFTEATGSNSLVFQDLMFSTYKNPFIHGEHVMYYNIEHLENLVDQIVFYLQPENEEKRKEIARNAFNHTMEFHTVKHRIDEIVDEYERLNTNNLPSSK